VELLIGVFFFGVVVNAALLVWLTRADSVTVHWPQRPQALVGAARVHPPAGNVPTLRQRSLFVASGTAAGGAVPPPAPSYPPLPPALNELLFRAASIAPHADGFDFGPSGNGTDQDVRSVASGNEGQVTALGGLHAPSASASTGLAPDPLTGLDGTTVWSRIIEIENARLLRYRRPATVVVAEVVGLRRLEERLGSEAVDRLLPVVADAFRREARSSDLVARIGQNRFAAFLPETDETQASNYVERIRLVCEPWLASSAVPLRLAVGWSSPTAASDLEFAIQRAAERMHDDRRLPGKSIRPARVAPARFVSRPPPSPGSADSPGGLEAGVPAAETGRFGEWMRPEKASEDAIRARPDQVS